MEESVITKDKTPKANVEMESDSGIKAVFDTYGASLTALYVPDRDGKCKNIVYHNPKAYSGAIIAPVAGRIADGAVAIGDVRYKMPCDETSICLHSGADSTAKKHWSIIKYSNSSIIFHTHLRDGACGLSGNRDITATYKLIGNSLVLDIIINTDADTFVNPTSHIYWNLSGDFNHMAHGHKLQILSDNVYYNDKSHLATALCKVDDTPFDFRKPTLWTDCDFNNSQLKNANGFNHAFVLQQDSTHLLTHSESGRELRLRTNASHLVVYSGGYLPIKGCAIALEPQLVPNAPAIMGSDIPALQAGKTFHWHTQYEFGVAAK